MHDIYKGGIIDKDIFIQLTEFNDKAFFKEMIEVFSKQNEIYLQELNSAINKKDTQAVKSVLHKMQGGANAIGAIKMNADIVKVRAFIKLNNQKNLLKFTKQLETSFLETKEELNKLKSFYS